MTRRKRTRIRKWVNLQLRARPWARGRQFIGGTWAAMGWWGATKAERRTALETYASGRSL